MIKSLFNLISVSLNELLLDSILYVADGEKMSMKVLVAADAQLYRTPDNKVWCRTIYQYNFWIRYLDVFDSIIVISRLENVDYESVSGYLRADGPGVQFKKMPMVRGAKGYVFHAASFFKAAVEASYASDCAIIRLPSMSAFFVELVYRWIRKPYVLEVVADPENAYAENQLIAKVIAKMLRSACMHANGVSYVTRFALQRQYPCRSIDNSKKIDTAKYFSSYYSSIFLKKDFFSSPKTYNHMGKVIHLIHTANNINNDVKGHDIVLKIVKNLQERGVQATITFIGDGTRRNQLEMLASTLGIADKVHFTGFLGSGLEVREQLLNADLFVFPTKAEGLPRALIEAMAVGLPCLSTPVNGIPELLESKYMFDPLDVDGFTDAIIRLIHAPQEMNEMSIRNIKKAEEYEYSILQQRRSLFFSKLKKIVIQGKKET